MAFQPVLNTARIEITFTQDGEPLQNVIYAKKNSTITAGDMQTLGETVRDWVEDQLQSTQSATCLFNSVTVTKLDFQNDLQVVVAGNGTGGSNGSGAMPSNVTKAFTLRSGLTGRSARGRMFYAGIANGVITPDRDHVSQEFVDDVLDILELLRLAIQAISWAWVIVSKYKDGVQRPFGETFTVTTFGVSNLTTDSARFRMPKT